jgi:malto-oligosyltrehalose trehalohydrolase
MTVLDVVYNHFGPDGAHLHSVAPPFFDEGRETPWGPGIDYAQPAVRAFFAENALMWLRDYRFDGLRLDAVHQIIDPSDPDLIEEIAAAVAAADLGRPTHLIAEDERNVTRHRDRGAVRAVWNDDWHHSVHCALTGEREGYFASFAVDPIADLVVACRDGHVEQGHPRDGRDAPRGEPSGRLPTTAFVNASQTHDQVGNRAHGERLIALADPRGVEVAHALLLCAPFIPMLFMGEEAGEDAPFLFFTDHEGDLADAVREGRRAEFAQFESFAGTPPDPNAYATFDRSRPFRGGGARARNWRLQTRALLAFRHEKIVPLLKSGRAAPTQARREGSRSLSALWRFNAGSLGVRANLGAPPDAPPDQADCDIGVGDIARDAYAFAAMARFA